MRQREQKDCKWITKRYSWNSWIPRIQCHFSSDKNYANDIRELRCKKSAVRGLPAKIRWWTRCSRDCCSAESYCPVDCRRRASDSCPCLLATSCQLCSSPSRRIRTIPDHDLSPSVRDYRSPCDRNGNSGATTTYDARVAALIVILLETLLIVARRFVVADPTRSATLAILPVAQEPFDATVTYPSLAIISRVTTSWAPPWCASTSDGSDAHNGDAEKSSISIYIDNFIHVSSIHKCWLNNFLILYCWTRGNNVKNSQTAVLHFCILMNFFDAHRRIISPDIFIYHVKTRKRVTLMCSRFVKRHFGSQSMFFEWLIKCNTTIIKEKPKRGHACLDRLSLRFRSVIMLYYDWSKSEIFTDSPEKRDITRIFQS